MLKLNLSQESQARLESERREALRLYSLTNQWLATALLRLARDARRLTMLRPEDGTYDSALVWGVVPELTRRLGLVKLEVAEIDWEIRELTDYELRQRIGHTLANASRRLSAPWDILTLAPAHGNPVAVGVDRLCPGRMSDREDPLTRGLTEISRIRHVAYEGVWTPEAFLPSALAAL